MLNIIVTLVKNSIKYKNTTKPLGRWVLNHNLKQQEYTANWASADHCGVCDDHHNGVSRNA